MPGYLHQAVSTTDFNLDGPILITKVAEPWREFLSLKQLAVPKTLHSPHDVILLGEMAVTTTFR